MGAFYSFVIIIIKHEEMMLHAAGPGIAASGEHFIIKLKISRANVMRVNNTQSPERLTDRPTDQTTYRPTVRLHLEQIK